MEFKDSGLPQNKLVEEAFNYSKANALAGEKEMLKNVQQQVGMIFDQQKHMLDMAKRTGELTPEEYEDEKKNLEKQRELQMNAVKPMVQKSLIELFDSKRVGPAQELVKNAESASPEVLAAVMLVDCVRSPIDYENIEKKFGSAVAGIVAEVTHIDAYPSERVENLQKAGNDTKRAYLSLLVTSLESISKEISKTARNPLQRVMLPPGQEEQLYNDATPIWGTDKKLDARFVEAFNKVAKGVQSVFRLEVGTAGDLQLVKDPSLAAGPKLLGGPKGPKPPKPPGNGGIGGDVF